MWPRRDRDGNIAGDHPDIGEGGARLLSPFFAVKGPAIGERGAGFGLQDAAIPDKGSDAIYRIPPRAAANDAGSSLCRPNGVCGIIGRVRTIIILAPY